MKNVFILDGKEYTFSAAFKKLLGKDKNTEQTRRDIYSYLMGSCSKEVIEQKKSLQILIDTFRKNN